MTLHDYILAGDIAATERALSEGADVECVGHAGNTPLIHAVMYTYYDMVALLLRHSADPTARSESLQEDTALHCVTYLPVREDTGRVIELLVQAGGDVNAQDGLHNTPLCTACSRRHLETAALLLRHGADVNLQRGSDRMTALHLAALDGHVETIQFLLEAGADQTLRDKHGKRPVEYAKEDEALVLFTPMVKSAAG